MRQPIKPLLCFLLILYQVNVFAEDTKTIADKATQEVMAEEYTINPGDLLEISVWKELELQREMRVLPDGHINFPLAGDIKASGLTLTQIKNELVSKLSEYISDPVVNVSVKSVEGNLIYVIGQVQRPGQFAMLRTLDVMQALSLAGGLTPFADANDILILRRTKNGSKAIEFEYGELEEGDDLDTNLVLQSGDVIVVP